MTETTTTRLPPKLGIIRGTRDYPELAAFDRLEGSVQRIPEGLELGTTSVHPLLGAPIASFRAQWNGDIEPHTDGTPLAVLRVIGIDPHEPAPGPDDEPDPEPDPEPEPTPSQRPIPDKFNRYQLLRERALRAAVDYHRDVGDPDLPDSDLVLDTAIAWERWIRTGKDPRTTLEPFPGVKP